MPFICILVVMLATLVLFKNQTVRNLNIGLYCLFVIYGYMHINKKYALVGFVALLVTYALVRSKSTEVVENMTNMNKNEEFKLPKSKSIEPQDESFNNAVDNAEDAEDAEETEEFENDTADDEKGIEQFGLADKFSQLHGMIHQMQNAAATASKKQQQTK